MAIAQAQVSGSRLVARRLVGNDGSQQFLGWTDTAHGGPCAIRAVRTEKDNVLDRYFCIPDGGEVVGQALDYTKEINYFADPNCTVPAVRADGKSLDGCQEVPPKFAVFTAGFGPVGGCKAQRVIAVYYTQGPELKQLYEGPLNCKAALSIYTGYALGDAIPLTAFQELTEESKP